MLECAPTPLEQFLVTRMRERCAELRLSARDVCMAAEKRPEIGAVSPKHLTEYFSGKRHRLLAPELYAVAQVLWPTNPLFNLYHGPVLPKRAIMREALAEPADILSPPVNIAALKPTSAILTPIEEIARKLAELPPAMSASVAQIISDLHSMTVSARAPQAQRATLDL